MGCLPRLQDLSLTVTSARTPVPSSSPLPLWRRDLLIALTSGVLIVTWDVLGWDLTVMRFWGSPQGFALSGHFWTQRVLHEGGRLLGWAMLLLVLLAAWRGGCGATAARWRAALATMLGCVALIAVLKQLSSTSCPWSLAEFGGSAHYVSHWQWGVRDGGEGRCFPSGHASTGFAFLALYFVWHPEHPRWARLALWVVGLAGLLFGMAQMLRGAHYPSHTLWTAWWCWSCTSLSYHGLWHRCGLPPNP